MSRYISIISFFLIFSMIFSFAAVPAQAVGWEQAVTFFGEWAAGYLLEKVADNLLGDYFDNSISNSPAASVFQRLFNNNKSISGCGHDWTNQRVGMKDGKIYYYCSICSKETVADLDDFSDAYNDYVSALPATMYDSSGGLTWKIVPPVWTAGSSGLKIDKAEISLSSDMFSVFVPISSHTAYSMNLYPSLASPFVSPVSGTYSLKCVLLSCTADFSFRVLSSSSSLFSSAVFYSAGSDVLGVTTPYKSVLGCFSFLSSGATFESFSGYYLLSCSPLNSLGDTYNIETRTTNITGDVYYYDVDGTVKLAPDITIVNEGDNTYYNPVTNETYEFNDWTYDYSDRSYNVTTNNGDDVTITYGDEYITIKEGDTIYYIYYYIEDDQPTETPEPTPTPTSTPTPGPVDPDGPSDGGDDDDNGILVWLKEFKVWLGEKLDNLTGGGGEEITNIDVTNNINDIDITYTDEDGEEKKSSIGNILDSFGWWKQVAEIGKEMVAQVSAAEVAAYSYDARAGGNPTGAPSIPVNLSAAQSPHGAVYGDDMEMLDLSWYTPYKKTVDDLVSGFLWLFFLWALFRHAPGIFSGTGLFRDRSSDVGSNSSSIVVSRKGD